MSPFSQACDIERPFDFAPTDPDDPDEWDAYWQCKIWHISSHDLIAPNRLDWLALFQTRHVHRLLFVGNGLCQEPKCYARLGFDAHVLDLSAVANEYAALIPFSWPILRDCFRPSERQIACLATKEEFSEVTFTTGALCRMDLCAGPYDAIFVRRVLRSTDLESIHPMLMHILRRLRKDGILIVEVSDPSLPTILHDLLRAMAPCVISEIFASSRP